MKILLAGYFGFGNIGDEAILSSMLDCLREQIAQVEFVVISHDPAGTTAANHVASVPWGNTDSIFKAALSSDLVMVGGGGLFHDYWPEDPSNVAMFDDVGQASYTGILALARLLGKRTMLYGVGLGPLSESRSRELTAAAVQTAQLVSVRDRQSLELAKGVTGEGAKGAARIRLTADPAFLLHPAPDPAVRKVLQALDVDPGSPILGICLRSWSHGSKEGWENEVAAALDRFLEGSNWQAIFLPFQTRKGIPLEDDLLVAEQVRVLMQTGSQTRTLDRILPPELMAAILGRCGLVLGMRYHAILFALLGGKPPVAMAYDPKVIQLMERAQLRQWVLPPLEWGADAIYAKLHQAAESSDRVPAAFCSEMLALARENAVLAANLLNEEVPPVTAADAATHHIALRYFAKVNENLALQDNLVSTREQAGRLLVDRNRMARELSDLRDTLGVRALDAYWRLARGIFPEGSPGRRIYRRGSRELRGLLGFFGFDMPATDRETRNSQLDLGAFVEGPGSNGRKGARTPSGDVRLELAEFEQHVRQTGAKQIVAIVSSTQLIESEGQRPTHLALGLAKLGIPVVFVYWRWDPSPATAQERLNEGILQVPIDEVVRDPAMLFGGFRGLDRCVLFEFPHPDFFDLIAKANATGWMTIYDVIDNWGAFSDAGVASWYQAPMEEHLVWTSDAVLAVNSSLRERVADMGRDESFLLPNGWPESIEKIDSVRPLPRGEITLGYFGHLAEEWVDWRLIAHVARVRPNWKIHIIGYGGQRHRERLASNIHMLGKKPQSSLAAYAANWDVGIVPFKEGALAKASDPIKTYEYMAMGLPIVMTGCYPPEGAESLVFRGQGETEFLKMAEIAAKEPFSRAEQRREFAAESTWGKRVDRLLSFLGGHPQRILEKRRLFEPVA